ncbi:hypothetical protein B566_EDAN010334, partial [Ephemera danica]
MVTPDLYGSADPYQRVPRSPKRLNESSSASEDRCRSPSTDQVYAVSSAEESDGGSNTPTICGETSPKPPVPTPEPDFVTPVAESPVEETIQLSSLSVSNTTPSTSTESISSGSTTTSEQPQRRPTSLWKSFSLKKLKGTFAAQKDSSNKLENIASSPVTTPTEPNCDLDIPQVAPTTSEPESPSAEQAEDAVEALEINGELSAENSETERQMDTLPVPPPRSRRKTPTPTPTEEDDVNKLLSRPKDLPLFEPMSKERKISLQQQLPKRKKNDLRKVNPSVQQSSTLGGLMKKKF